MQELKLCIRKRRNFQKRDDVLLRANSNRNHWSIARMIETFADKHGIVRTIKLGLGNAVRADQRKLVLSITKFKLLLESDSLMEKEKR